MLVVPRRRPVRRRLRPGTRRRCFLRAVVREEARRSLDPDQGHDARGQSGQPDGRRYGGRARLCAEVERLAGGYYAVVERRRDAFAVLDREAVAAGGGYGADAASVRL